LRRFWHWAAMLEQDLGLPASPRVRYILKVPAADIFLSLKVYRPGWHDRIFARRRPF
jgi:hypothetical protein